MMSQTIQIEQHVADYIEEALSRKDDNMLNEDETIVRTVRFPDGIEMDIKCCGVQYEEGGDNSAWTEAVLFHNGYEVACSEPSDSFLGEWILPYRDETYCVNVVVQ